VRNESVAEFMIRRKKLEALARPADSEIAFFNDHMQIANQHGMDYQEALEFIIRMRKEGAH
jgi:hypothetical protein